MAKLTIKHNPRATQVLDDLELYLDFCRKAGYKFDERDLYNYKAYPYQQYLKCQQGKNYKDQWSEDARRLGCAI